MNKIPTGHVIRSAYRYFRDDFWVAIKLLWVPALVMGATTQASLLAPEDSAFALALILPVMGVAIIVSVLTGSLIIRRILIEPNSRIVERYRLGRKELRMLVASLLVNLMALFAAFLLGITGYLIGNSLAQLLPGFDFGQQFFASGFAWTFGAIGLISVTVVTSILLFPIILFEESGGIRQCFRISVRHFWSLLLIFVLAIILFWIPAFFIDPAYTPWLFPNSPLGSL